MIRLSKSVVGAREKEAAGKAIDDGYLGMGSFVKEFEERLGGYLGVNNVMCVNSGTAALHLGLMGAGIKRGDEVLVQSLTFVGSFQAITATGARAIPCEVVPATCAIDLKDAKKKMTAKTRAIMPVHYASRPGHIDEIYAFARRHGLRVIEDAAHAFGTIHQGKKIGSFGDIVCFSFDGIKNITAGEGGAVITQDAGVAERVKDARLVGVHKDTEKRYQGQRSWQFDVFHQGYRYHMSNINAAIGMVQLERLEKEFKPARQKLARKYNDLLDGVEEVSLFEDDYSDTLPHIYVIRVKGGRRDALKGYLADKGIETGIHYYPNHYLTYFGKGKWRLPVTEGVYQEILSLPLHPAVTSAEQKYIAAEIKKFFKQAAAHV